jgi:flagellar hook-associated protein 2
VVQAAADAQVIIGTGAGAVTASSSTNTINNALAGVTLQAIRATPGQSVTLSVSPDTKTAGDAIQAFVDSYNAVIDDINQQDSYNQQTQQAGPLLGNGDVSALLRDLGNTLSNSVPYVNSSANRLGSIGITFSDQGDLQFDQSRFESVFNGQISGVSAADVKRLFGLTGSSSSPGVNFLLGSDKTKPTNGTPYQVHETQAAIRASITAANQLASSITIDGTNNAFTVRLNNLQSSQLTIASGTYTPSALAAQLQAAINADQTLSGGQVIVDLDSNKLRITSQVYGTSGQVSIGTGSAVTSGVLGFAGNESAVGQDVAGSFLVNNVVEQATGIGQILSGISGNAHTDGLQVQVTLNSSQVASNPDSNLTVTSGLADRLNQVLSNYLDPVSGRFKTIDDEFNSKIKQMDDAITQQNQLLQTKTTYLQQQFTAMEQAISKLNTVSLQINSLFAGSNGNNSSSSNGAKLP